MKKLLYTFLAVSIIFAACKKEEDATPPPEASIVGTWTATNVVGDSSFIVSYMGVTVDSLSSSGTITATPEMAGTPTSLDFLSSGTGYAEFSYDGPMEIDTFTYSISGNNLTITGDGEMLSFDYTVSQSDLAVVDGGSQDTSVIVDFGAGPMTLDIAYNYSNSLNFTRNTNGIVNNNGNQRIGNTNNSWLTKPKLNDILKTIK